MNWSSPRLGPTVDPDQEPTPPPWPYLLFTPLIIGGITGTLVGLLTLVVETWLLETVVLGLPGLRFVIPALFVFVLTRFALLKIAGTNKPGTAELYPYYYHHPSDKYPLRQVPGRLLSGVSTVGLGGSQGLESQSVMVGSTVGLLLNRLFANKLSYLNTVAGRRLLLVSGAAAGITTVFSSPMLGALYGIEMPFRNRLDFKRLLVAFIAAGSSFLMASLTHTSRSLLTYIDHDISAVEMFGVVVVGIICGFGARAFARTANKIRSWNNGSHPWLRAVGAGIALASLGAVTFLITGAAVTAGPGYIASGWALPPNDVPPAFWILVAALVLRAASVLLCVAAGGGGGVFTSMATNGLLIGTATAVALGLSNPTLLALAGASAFLAAGYRLPLAAAGLAIGVSGAAEAGALCLIAIGLSMTIMGWSESASSTQTDDISGL